MNILKRIAGFFRRLFRSKGFDRGLKIFIGVYIAYMIYSLIVFYQVMKSVGMPFDKEALKFFFQMPVISYGFPRASASLAIGIGLGLVWYFRRRRKSGETEEPEETAEESPEPVQEEETIENTQKRYF